MYIHDIYSIHPVKNEISGANYKKMAVHDFSDLFEKNEIRRLSILIRNGIGAGLRVVNASGKDNIYAIISGTGKGSISKIEQFLRDIDTYNETALNPGVFIQSTHNTINGQLALKTQSKTYNMTHVNQGFTLHNVLMDAQLLAGECDDKYILAGVFEENTDFNIEIHEQAGLSGIPKDDQFPIIWGEGVTFFSLSSKANTTGIKIKSSKCFSNLYGSDHWSEAVDYLCALPNTSNTVYLLGYNSEEEKNTIYKPVIEFIEKNQQQYYNFKSDSGEHDTAGGYAIYLAHELLKGTPEFKGHFDEDSISKVIIFNHFKDYVCHIIEMNI